MSTSGRIALALVLFLPPASVMHAQDAATRYVNPPNLPPATGYTHVVVAPDGGTVYIAGQIALDSAGRLVGAGDFRTQAEQVYANLSRALASVGGTLSDLVKTTTFITDATQVAILREVRTRHLDAARPPANSLIPVAALARKDLLIEIGAVAILRNPARPCLPSPVFTVSHVRRSTPRRLRCQRATHHPRARHAAGLRERSSALRRVRGRAR